ncbi:MAG: pilus assembly protein PilZ [Gammaproteobacteria bacterium]|jgi:type IV pilus assembly protein PilZ|nr:pilus assembly protein PilZ [Gammaproteobacteria bacterium]
MSKNQRTRSKKNIFPLHISDVHILENIYMPYIKNGGLFVPADTDAAIGDQVFLMITLFDHATKIAIDATVIWITPKHTQENKVQGFGVSFNDVRNKFKNKLESALPARKNTSCQALAM